jgi:DNA-binding FrmR family transcriptional regulator
VEDIDMASIKAGYHAVAVQLHERTGKETQADKPHILKRLHYIEGHLGGIGKMIEEDTSCIDVLRQTYAVRKAIQKLEALLVENHLARRVYRSITRGDEEALLAELIQFFQLIGNRR